MSVMVHTLDPLIQSLGWVPFHIHTVYKFGPWAQRRLSACWPSALADPYRMAEGSMSVNGKGQGAARHAALSQLLSRQCGFRVNGCSHGSALEVRAPPRMGRGVSRNGNLFISPFIKVTAAGGVSGSQNKSQLFTAEWNHSPCSLLQSSGFLNMHALLL